MDETLCPKCGSEETEWRGHAAGWRCFDCDHEWEGPRPSEAKRWTLDEMERGADQDPR